MIQKYTRKLGQLKSRKAMFVDWIVEILSIRACSSDLLKSGKTKEEF